MVSRDPEQAHAYLETKQGGGDCSHTKLPSGPQCRQINTNTEEKIKKKKKRAHTKQQQSLPCPKPRAFEKLSEGEPPATGQSSVLRASLQKVQLCSTVFSLARSLM